MGLSLSSWAFAAVKSVDNCGVVFVDCSPDTGKGGGGFTSGALDEFGSREHQNFVALFAYEFIRNDAIDEADFEQDLAQQIRHDGKF